jgi:hypothetical protein
LTLREEHRLRVFENRVLRRIFGSKRDDMTGGWRKLRSGSGQGPVEGSCENGNELSGSIKCWEALE